jgi:hypothetical protein
MRKGERESTEEKTRERKEKVRKKGASLACKKEVG